MNWSVNERSAVHPFASHADHAHWVTLTCFKRCLVYPHIPSLARRDQAGGSAFSWLRVILDLASRVAVEHPSAFGLLVSRGTLLTAKPTEIGNRDCAGGKQVLWRRRVSVVLDIGSCQHFPALFTNDVRKALLHTAERCASPNAAGETGGAQTR